MNRHLKFLIKISTLMLLIATPFTTLFLVTELTANQYNNTYLAEFNDKYSRLNSINVKATQDLYRIPLSQFAKSQILSIN